MALLTTPGIYLRDQSIQVESESDIKTAVPVFIGYTDRVLDGEGESIENRAVKIRSPAEFQSVFGGEFQEGFRVREDSAGALGLIDSEQGTGTFFLKQAIDLFYANGGALCYVVSIGGFRSLSDEEAVLRFCSAVDSLETLSEATLLCIPESVLMGEQALADVQNKALMHCQKMGDRVCLLDVQQRKGFARSDVSRDASGLRNRVVSGLPYGAAYYPYLRTSIARSYSESDIHVSYSLVQQKLHSRYDGPAFITLSGKSLDQYGYVVGERESGAEVHQVYIKLSHTITVDTMGFRVDENGQRLESDSDSAYGIFTDDSGIQFLNHEGLVMSSALDNVPTYVKNTIPELKVSCSASMRYLSNATGRLSSSTIYDNLKTLLNENYLIVPPSPAMAGMFTSVDALRGVWVTPANIEIQKMIEPVVNVDSGEQQQLNVDVVSGKSINTIRQFLGKGSRPWGGRTLAGNDNEWRYMSVRRLFNMVETRLKQSTSFAVFEVNNAFTWLKLKVMIETYLETIWRQGALFGESPSSAYFVNVGLGQTMTEHDINNGVMHIEVGLAAVRPSEFIVLTFSHKSLDG